MFCAYVKKFVCTTAVLLLYGAGAVFAAPDSEVQLDTMANAQELWKYDFADLCTPEEMPPYLDSFDPDETQIAVTDLDANGRLELLVRHAARMPGDVPDLFARLPTVVGMTVYEIGTDGHLSRLIERHDAACPDLFCLDGRARAIDAAGTRGYIFRTTLLSKEEYYRFTTSYDQIAIVDGTVLHTICAQVDGVYGGCEGGRFEAVPLAATIHDGDPAHTNMDPFAFAATDFFKNFRDTRKRGNVHWIKGAQLLAEPRTALAASWYGFSHGT